jgi:hypothetical protein
LPRKVQTISPAAVSTVKKPDCVRMIKPGRRFSPEDRMASVRTDPDHWQAIRALAFLTLLFLQG